MSISNELLNDCRKKLKNKFTKEFIEKKESSDNFINALINTDNFDIFYSMLEEEYSKNIFKKIVLYRYMLAFYSDAYTNINKKIKLSIKHGIINIFSWGIKRVLFYLKRHKYPNEIENFLLFYIFGLEQYNRLVSKVLDKSIYSFKEVRIMLIYS